MKTADVILKKAALFEKLSLYGNRRDFLKAIATNDPVEWKEKYFLPFIEMAKSALAQVPADKKNTDAYSRASTILSIDPDQSNMDDLKVAIDALVELVPWAAKDPNNSLLTAYQRVRSEWQAPRVPGDDPILPSQVGDYTKVAPPAAAGPQSLESLFNFYNSKLQDATQKSNLADMFKFIPKVEQIVAKLPEFSPLRDKGQRTIYDARMKAGLGMGTPPKALTDKIKSDADPFSGLDMPGFVSRYAP
jgi:hypothetical protein